VDGTVRPEGDGETQNIDVAGAAPVAAGASLREAMN
jgi:hypothetical protein